MEEELLEELGNEPLEDAKKLGMIVDGWGILDYLQNAIEKNGYEMVLIWGNQGSGKSSFMLYLAYQILGDWDKVLNQLCFTPMDVIRKAEELPFGKRYPLLLWDDVGVHFPATSFRTNIDIYEAVGRMLDVYRTIASVIICTAPDIRRFPKVMRDNETIEVWMTRLTGENISYYRALRIVKLQNYYSDLEIYLKKPTIEHGFYQLDKHIPRNIWNTYWEKRLELSRKAVEMLKEKLNPQTKKDEKREENEEKTTLIKCPNGHVWIPRKKHMIGEKVKCPKCGKYFRIGIE
jgi:hypothetical protein